MATINNLFALKSFIYDELNNWNCKSDRAELTEALTHKILRMSCPLFGTDWSEFLEELEWDELIAETDRKVHFTLNYSPERAEALYREAYKLLDVDTIEQGISDLNDLMRNARRRFGKA